MVKTRKIKVKSIENEEIIMAMTMTKTIITQIIITIMMKMRIKIGKNIKTLKQNKSVQVKAIHICLKRVNAQKAIFYWNAKVTCCRCLYL